jgi:predicted GIY-YIG superfamily endonuclease
MGFWVYILRCVDRSYYVGHTEDLEKRIGEHESGLVRGWTQRRRPVRIAYAEEFPTREEALAAERRIKGWRRETKEALIARDWNRLSALARRHGRLRP